MTVSFRSGQNYVPPGLVYDPNKILLSKSIADWESAARARIANDRQTISAESRTVEGDPVDLRTGEFTYENTYLRLSGIGLPYELSAYYRSQVMADGILGHGWRTSYERRVEERPDGTVVYHDERFGTHEFASSGSGTYAYLASYRARLAKTGTGFDLVYDDLRSLAFDLSGRLVRLSDPSGNAISFSYDGDRIVSATDTLGRTVSYTYSASGQLADITAPD